MSEELLSERERKAAVLLAYHLGIFRADGAAAPAAAAGAEDPVLAVALVRAADREALRALERALGRHRPAGVELDLREISPATAAELRALLPDERG